MKRVTALSVGEWAHHSWLVSGQRPRTERAQAAASALLLARYQRLADIDFTTGLPLLMGMPRPAYARLLRIAAALACARSLRRVITASSRAAFAASTAPGMLALIQQHARGYLDDVSMNAAPDIFNRRHMTAAGLALALHTLDDAAQRMWLQLRLPREVAEEAARYQIVGVSSEAVKKLLEDASRLMRGDPC